MPWRDPRSTGEFFAVSCASMRELAATYHPILRYADSERIFPVLAESWLTHVTAAPWAPEAAEEDDLPVDPWQRGTGIYRAPDGVHRVDVLGGPPNPHDRPIQLSSEATDPDAIGNPAYAGNDERVFLGFGGWLPDGKHKRGDADYLAAAFSELGGAMNPAVEWRLIEEQRHLPHPWIPQPVNPTVYAEAEWAGMYARWCTAFKQSDFPSSAGDLDDLLSLTYYYLYPLREPPPGEREPRRLEGQWEAVSLFFPARRSEETRPDGRPKTLHFAEPPRHVVISKGIERALGPKFPNELRPWSTVEKRHAHPVIYVGAGTHRHFFAPASGTVWDPNQPKPGDELDTDGVGEFPGVETLLFLAVVLAAVAAALIIAGLIVAAAALLLLALLLFLLWLISLLWDAINQASGDPVPAWQGADDAQGNGPQGGSADEPPAGGSSGPDPSATAKPGTPNSGSPTGRDTVSFDVRLVDMLHESEERTGFPAERECEHPHWWDYTGSWGVHVAPSLDNDWESGMRRVDAQRRSWGYWNALRVMTVLHGGSVGP